MKICFVITKLNINGGGENHDVIMKVRALQEKGHEVVVVTIFSTFNNIPKDINVCIIEEQAKTIGLLGLQIFIVRLLKKHAPRTDVFYLVGSSFIFGGGWYRIFTKNSKPIVADLNGYVDFVEAYYKKESLYPSAYLPHTQSLLRKVKYQARILLERSLGVYLINHLDAIVIMTKTIAQYYIRAGIKKDKVTIIPSFQDIRALQQEPLQSNPFSQYPENTFHILCAGRIHIDKGVDILIEAFSQCRCQNAILHIVGDGPEKVALEEIVNKKGLSEKVKFYPWQKVDRLVAFYQHADLFVHPARLPEPMVRTTLEAMSFGLPLVVTATSSEHWVAKEVAKMFVLGDVLDLRTKVEAAYRDKFFLENARIRGKKRAIEFDYRQHIPCLNDMLVLLGKPEP